MNRYDRPSSAWRSSRRLITPAWIETSSADTGSSRMMSFGRRRRLPVEDRASGGALAAARLPHEAERLVRVQIEGHVAHCVDLTEGPADDSVRLHREVLHQAPHRQDRSSALRRVRRSGWV